MNLPCTAVGHTQSAHLAMLKSFTPHVCLGAHRPPRAECVMIYPESFLVWSATEQTLAFGDGPVHKVCDVADGIAALAQLFLHFLFPVATILRLVRASFESLTTRLPILGLRCAGCLEVIDPINFSPKHFFVPHWTNHFFPRVVKRLHPVSVFVSIRVLLHHYPEQPATLCHVLRFSLRLWVLFSRCIRVSVRI